MNDAHNTFQQDQAEAASRDQQAWENNLARAQMEVAAQASHASHLRGLGQFWSALASLVNVAWVMALLYGLAYLAHLITGKGF